MAARATIRQRSPPDANYTPRQRDQPPIPRNQCLTMTDPTPMVSTPMMTTKTICPLCRLPMAQIGRLVAFTDRAKQSFTFDICTRCSSRLDRLPAPQQDGQVHVAICNLAKHPERYRLRAFDSQAAAHLFVHLQAEQMRKGKSDIAIG